MFFFHLFFCMYVLRHVLYTKRYFCINNGLIDLWRVLIIVMNQHRITCWSCSSIQLHIFQLTVLVQGPYIFHFGLVSTLFSIAKSSSISINANVALCLLNVWIGNCLLTSLPTFQYDNVSTILHLFLLPPSGKIYIFNCFCFMLQFWL